MNKRTVRAAVSVAFVAASLAHATPVPVLDLRELTSSADVIALGTIQDRQEIGTAWIDTPNSAVHARVMLVDVAIDEVLKGSLPSSTVRARFLLPEVPIGLGTVNKDSYRMVFLRQRGEEYEFVSPYYPSVIAVAGPPTQGASLEDRVFSAIARVLHSPREAAQAKLEAIRTLWRVDRPVVISGLRVGLQDADDSVQLTAAAGLLAANDVSALSLAEAILLAPVAGVEPRLLQNLRAGVSEGITQPAAIPALTRLLNGGDDETRRAAATALGRMQSTSAIRALASALDDGDFEVRLNAVRGLAALTGQKELTPSWDAFRNDEWRFVGPLKVWIASKVGNP